MKTVVARFSAADAQMMSHFYSPLHHMYHSMHSSSLHPHGPRYPGMEVGGKYPPSAGYPEQKYDPVQGEASTGSVGEVGRYDGAKHSLPTITAKCGGPSPGSSPHQAVETSGYHQHEENRSYLTPPAGQVTPDIKPQHDQNLPEADKELSESSIEAPGERPEEKVGEFSGSSSSHLGSHEAGYGGSSSGYYHHSDLSHPSYGGYSTAGPFPLSSPLARPRSNKNKSNSGEARDHIIVIWLIVLWGSSVQFV